MLSKIGFITLDCKAIVPELNEEDFMSLAKDSKAKLPIFRLTTVTDEYLGVKLVS